jgi:hypothetical protein
LRKPSLEELAARSGMRSEHVMLESEQALEPAHEAPRTVRKRYVLRNRIRRSKTVLILFDNGLLTVRQQRKGKKKHEFGLDLRYLDPRPAPRRFVAKKTLRIGASLIALSILTGVVAYFGVLFDVMALIGSGSLVAGAATLLIGIRHTEERVTFRTLHGRAIVLTLLANLGCFRACRALAPQLVTAITEARRRNTNDRQRLLREEVREHYRLTETRVLSERARAAAVREVLAHFD